MISRNLQLGAWLVNLVATYFVLALIVVSDGPEVHTVDGAVNAIVAIQAGAAVLAALVVDAGLLVWSYRDSREPADAPGAAPS
jgi:hypothetical protein